jgi:hypothetical protein
VEHRSECLSPRSLEGTRVRGVVSNPSYNAAEYTELANPILSLWQQCNFRKENMIDGLPPLLRNAEDPKSIILDLIYERMRLALQLASLFHTVSEEFFVKICRAKVCQSSQQTSIRWRIRPERCWCHSQTRCTYTRDSY